MVQRGPSTITDRANMPEGDQGIRLPYRWQASGTRPHWRKAGRKTRQRRRPHKAAPPERRNPSGPVMV
ncbi:hypothetical protein JCM25156A_22200 [Komagataeibacter kakiaceti JCM 25156]